ncbi:hypothetical protein B9Z19DRAFT_1149046, partial [Tuber borchii]
HKLWLEASPCAKKLYSWDGSFQQYTIGKAAHVARIPKGAPLNVIALILCAGITVCTRLPIVPTKLIIVAIVGAGGGPSSLAVQYANAINTGSETQEMFLNTLGAEEFVDFAKGDVVATVKSVAEGLGAHAATLLSVSEKPSQQAAEIDIP